MGTTAKPAAPSRLSAAWAFMTRRRGDRRWDLLLRTTGAAALVGIPIVLLLPEATPLVMLVLLGIPANGPLSPVMPTAFEPLIMEAAKYNGPLVVAVVATSVYMFMEYLNFHLYRWVILRDRFEKYRTKGWVQRTVTAFGRWPFATIVVFAITPLPFWVARILAILRHYSVPRYMAATAIGRLPRFLLYAWAGEALHVPTWVLLIVLVGGGVAVVGWRTVHGKPVFPNMDQELKTGEGRAPEDPGERHNGVASP